MSLASKSLMIIVVAENMLTLVQLARLLAVKERLR